VAKCEERGEAGGEVILSCEAGGLELLLRARREGAWWRVEPLPQSRAAFERLTGRRYVRVLGTRRQLRRLVEGRLGSLGL